jgi:hypothetical protein
MEYATSPGAGSVVVPDAARGAAPLGSQWHAFLFNDQSRKVATAETTTVARGVPSIEAQIFSNRVAIRVATSQVAMHLTDQQRRILFSEFDRLLDVAHWEDESALVNLDAFRTFLRFMIYARPRRLPNLGVDQDGAVLASWRSAAATVFAEFASGDECVAMIKGKTARGEEVLTWKGHAARLRDIAGNAGAGAVFD